MFNNTYIAYGAGPLSKICGHVFHLNQFNILRGKNLQR